MHHHQGYQDAEEEEDEHGVLHELDVVRMVETLSSDGIQSIISTGRTKIEFCVGLKVSRNLAD